MPPESGDDNIQLVYLRADVSESVTRRTDHSATGQGHFDLGHYHLDLGQGGVWPILI